MVISTEGEKLGCSSMKTLMQFLYIPVHYKKLTIFFIL